MILIGQYDSPYVRRVAVAMVHYGMTFEHRPWSVWGDADRIAQYSPLRRVPVLVTDDGETLVESYAILDALDDGVGPDRALLPRTGPLRRAGLRICALATGVADKAVSLFYERTLHKTGAQSDMLTERYHRQIRDTLDLLESDRDARPGEHWLGDALSHADIAVTCALRFTREAHPVLLDDRPRLALATHAARCESMPVFQRVVQAFHVAL